MKIGVKKKKKLNKAVKKRGKITNDLYLLFWFSINGQLLRELINSSPITFKCLWISSYIWSAFKDIPIRTKQYFLAAAVIFMLVKAHKNLCFSLRLSLSISVSKSEMYLKDIKTKEMVRTLKDHFLSDYSSLHAIFSLMLLLLQQQSVNILCPCIDAKTTIMILGDSHHYLYRWEYN